jgi:hypothetical protein
VEEFALASAIFLFVLPEARKWKWKRFFAQMVARRTAQRFECSPSTEALRALRGKRHESRKAGSNARSGRAQRRREKRKFSRSGKFPPCRPEVATA